uniref:F-box domain-containing protein n=1 Tax=Ciona savignyi TaxID=51511 RepID=H2ZME9_CIOSA
MKQNGPKYIKQYAVGIIDYSSQYGGENRRSFSYSVSNIMGEPQIFPKYGDFTQAAVMRTYGPWWEKCESPKYKKDNRPRLFPFASQDYIDVVFDQAVYPWSIAIYETYNPGSLVRILALCQHFPNQTAKSDRNNNVATDPDILGKAIPLPLIDGFTHWEVLWDNPHPQHNLPTAARMFAPILREIKHRSRIIRLEFCHSHLEYYAELDAVELTGTLEYSGSSPVDPPSGSMSAMKLDKPSTSIITPSSSSEDLAFSESKIDYSLSSAVDPEDFSCLNSDPTDEDNPEHAPYPGGAFSQLPAELLSKIFSYLSFPDFCRAAQVCTLFRSHSYDPAQFNCLNLHTYWHMVNENTLAGIVDRCKHGCTIQTLNMRWVGGGDIMSSDQLHDFFRVCDLLTLTFLDVGSSPCITDKVLKAMTDVLPHLNHLNIESCDKPTSEGLRVLHKFSNLETLNLYRTKVDDAGIICVLRSNTQLESLNLGSCQHILDYDKVFMEMAAHCQQIRIIDVWRARSLTSQGLNELTTHCKHLEELDFGWCGTLQSSTGCFTHLAKSCRNLHKLFLTANRTVSDAEIRFLAEHCPKLRQLDILGTRQVSVAAIELLLLRCPDMQFLDLSFCFSFTVEVVNGLRTLYPHVSIKRSFQE